MSFLQTTQRMNLVASAVMMVRFARRLMLGNYSEFKVKTVEILSNVGNERIEQI